MKFQANYSIRDLEKLSGIKAHTLRIWEKRYALFEPDRTDTNIRYYSNDDLKRILNISLLNKNGYKISRIAEMRDAEISEKVSAINMVKTENEDLIDNLIVGMIDLDEPFFDRIFSSSILRIGFENTILKVVFPFFHRIGIMWQTGGINPAQEHFVSNIVRQKLIVAIDGIKIREEKKSPAAVLFLPEHELHELSLLFYNYALKARNFRTVYLGQTVPAGNIARIAEIVKPEYLVSVITSPLTKKETEKLFHTLGKLQGVKRVLLSGKAVLDSGKKFPKGIHLFKDLQELLGLIQR
jgi:MerR family transcriptional regulator, light-induced transcriptional regulator